MDMTQEPGKGEMAREGFSRDNMPLASDPNFNGPLTERYCTDWCWLFVFLVANAALAAFAVYSYWVGAPERLIHGWDFRAELCGQGGLTNKPYAYFLAPRNSTTAICLEGCPVLDSLWAVCLYDVDHVHDMEGWPCYDAYVSKPFANRYCIPNDPDLREEVLDWLYDPMQVTTRATGDLYRAWDVLAISGVVSAITVLFYLVILRIGVCLFPLGVISLVAMGLLFAGISFMIYEESDKVADDVCGPFEGMSMTDCDRSRWSQSYEVLAYSTAVLFIGISLGAMTFSYRLWSGSKLISLSSRPLRNATCVSFLPCIVMLLGAGVYAMLLTFVTYASGTGSIDTESVSLIERYVKTINFEIAPRVLIFYVLLMTLWWFSLLSTVTEYLTASYTCYWFFGKDKSSLIQPFRNSLKHAFRYHMGSLILASVVVPAFRIPRYILGAIRRFASLTGIDSGNCCSKCCGLCFDCYDHAFRYLDYHTLPYQALFGGSFSDAAKRGFYLIARNQSQCKRLISSGDYYIWLFQLTVTLSSPVFTYYWLIHMDTTFRDEMTKHISSVTCMSVVSLIVSWYMAQVLGSIMRGLLYASVISYLSDNEMFIGGQRFADDQIAGLFGEGYEAVSMLKPIDENTKKRDESLQEFLAESPFKPEKTKAYPEIIKSQRPLEIPEPVKPLPKPASPKAKIVKTDGQSSPKRTVSPPKQVIKTDAPKSPRQADSYRNRGQAFEQPLRPPPIPDILRQTVSSATSSDYSSTPSDARFFIPPHVVPPPASPKGSEGLMKKKTEAVTFRSARGPPSPRRPAPVESSGSDSLSSYTDSEGDEDYNRRPIARPSSRGESPARRRGGRRGGRKA